MLGKWTTTRTTNKKKEKKKKKKKKKQEKKKRGNKEKVMTPSIHVSSGLGKIALSEHCPLLIKRES